MFPTPYLSYVSPHSVPGFQRSDNRVAYFGKVTLKEHDLMLKGRLDTEPKLAFHKTCMDNVEGHTSGALVFERFIEKW